MLREVVRGLKSSQYTHCVHRIARPPSAEFLDLSSEPTWFEPRMPSRRAFLLSAAAVPALLAGRAAHAQVPGVSAPGFWDQPRWVWVRRPDTGEEAREIYWADGRLIPEAYQRLSWALRDLHMEDRLRGLQRRRAAGERVEIPVDWYAAVAMSPVLLDILYAYCGWLKCFGIDRPLLIPKGGGFRHPITNANTEGAAKDSRHQHGGAADPTIQGVDATASARFGLWLRAGGIGVYPAHGFTHVDDGRLRFWHGK
jgi:uncharacterized protein YcbK (DUF882 family)